MMKNESLKLQAYQQLKEMIIRCEYAPGSLLSEEALHNELNMSRTPIRDALGRLEQDGLVSIRSKKGVLVTDLSINEVNMVFELRLMLECHALLNYGYMLDENQLLSFYHRFNDLQNAASEQDYFSVDDAFHAMLISSVPNTYIHRSYDQVTSQNRRFRIITGVHSRLTDTTREHNAIITACLKKDWTQASDAMRIHLAASKSVTLDHLLSQHK